MSNDEFRVQSTKFAKLWFVAKRSCMPGLLGGAVCVLAMIVVDIVGFDSFFATELPAPVDKEFTINSLSSSSLNDLANQVRARFVWSMSSVIMIMATIGVMIISWYIISEILNDAWRDLRGLVLTVTFATAGVGFIAALLSQAIQHAVSSPDLLGVLLEKLNANYETPLWLLPAVLNSAVVSTTVLLGVSFSIVTAPSPPNKQDDIGDLINRIYWLRRLLYFSAACLVTRVVEVYALYMWPTAYLAGKEASSITDIATSTSAAVGVIYSLFLGSVYLPAAENLHGRLSKCVRLYLCERDHAATGQGHSDNALEPKEEHATPFDVLVNLDKTLHELGIVSKPYQALTRMMALVTPLIVGFLQGPVATMIGNILKEFSSN